jgi:murein DD-endopeptidase MepM/ murein hydrolase activator NlpD
MPTARIQHSAWVIVVAAAATAPVAGRTPALRATRASIDVRVAVPPTAFMGSDTRTHLAYELSFMHLSGATSARLERLSVFAGSNSKPLIAYSSTDLDERVMNPEASRDNRYGRALRSGSTAIVYVWITLAQDRPVPRTLRHSFAIVADDGTEVHVGDARVDVRSATPLVIGAPFGAGRWFAHNGPGQHRSAHWGSALVDQRGGRIPQRYAIDFMGVDDNGRAVRGDVQKSTNNDWIGFGREVLAAVDGVVYAARDGIPDNPALVEPSPPASPSVSDTYGNYVIISVDNHTFVHYAHLQRNSVKVRAGQRVRRGQVIGRLGNSGNTNGAHLHFNVTDNPDQERAQGLPFLFTSFQSFGRTTADAAVGAEPSSGVLSAPSKHDHSLPLDGTIVRFQ